jgi:hypothetical protein
VVVTVTGHISSWSTGQRSFHSGAIVIAFSKSGKCNRTQGEGTSSGGMDRETNGRTNDKVCELAAPQQRAYRSRGTLGGLTSERRRKVLVVLFVEPRCQSKGKARLSCALLTMLACRGTLTLAEKDGTTACQHVSAPLVWRGWSGLA